MLFKGHKNNHLGKHTAYLLGALFLASTPSQAFPNLSLKAEFAAASMRNGCTTSNDKSPEGTQKTLRCFMRTTAYVAEGGGALTERDLIKEICTGFDDTETSARCFERVIKSSPYPWPTVTESCAPLIDAVIPYRDCIVEKLERMR